MAGRKFPYKEGDWFVLPLKCSAYALGLAARVHGGGILAYFFGPRLERLPEIEEIGERQPEDAIAIAMIGGLGLVRGTWKVIGRKEPWDRSIWPMPVFGRYDEVFDIARKITWAEDMLHQLREEPATFEEIKDLPRDGLWGYAFAEARLSRLLCSSSD